MGSERVGVLECQESHISLLELSSESSREELGAVAWAGF